MNSCACTGCDGHWGFGAPLSGSFSCLWPPLKYHQEISWFYQRFYRQTCLCLFICPSSKLVCPICFNYEMCLRDDYLSTLNAVCFGPRCKQSTQAFYICMHVQDQCACMLPVCLTWLQFGCLCYPPSLTLQCSRSDSGGHDTNSLRWLSPTLPGAASVLWVLSPVAVARIEGLAGRSGRWMEFCSMSAQRCNFTPAQQMPCKSICMVPIMFFEIF